MRLTRLAVILSFILAPVAADGQQAAKIARIGFLALNPGADMTSGVKLHDETKSGPALVSVFIVVARATGRDGACNCDG
jgi:hypothetical protein